MRTLAPALVLCVALTVLTVVGCTDKSDTGPTPTVELSWSAAKEAQAIQDAEQALKDYYRVRAQCLSDPQNTDRTCFEQISMNSALSNDLLVLETAQEHDLHYVGEIKVLSIEPIDVQGSVGIDTVRLYVCVDRSSVEGLRADGTKPDDLVGPRPPDWHPHIYRTVILSKYRGVWKVAEFPDETNKEVVPC